MENDVYRRLARRLDEIPNGFPATESGVELKLLATMFTPEEAALGAVMRLRTESASDIAARAGQDPDEAEATLKGMARKGLVRVRRGKGELLFALLPFVVGAYEEQLSRMDERMARLFEEYVHEAFATGVLEHQPALHRVIPVEEAIPVEIEIFPYERASQLLEGAKSWAVRECICRKQKSLIGEPCDYPRVNCLVFAPVENAFRGSHNDTPVTKEEAFRILREAEEAGLIHSTGNVQQGHNYICNCCTCCCGIMRGVSEFGIANAMARSDFYATVDADECTGCESCFDRCQFHALSLDEDDICRVDLSRCVGCGVCVSACPSDALSLRRKPPAERTPLPQDRKAWLVERARSRGVSVEKVL